MKKLKFILTIIFLSQCFTGFAQITQGTQDPNNTPYVGTWEYVDGNQIFRLFLEEDTDPVLLNRYRVLGHYEMVEINTITNEEDILYTSRPNTLPEGAGAFFGIFRSAPDRLGGQFHEFHTSGLRGTAVIKLEQACSTCPQKIKWELTPTRDGIRVVLPGEPTYSSDFEVPTDIVLEKVN